MKCANLQPLHRSGLCNHINLSERSTNHKHQPFCWRSYVTLFLQTYSPLAAVRQPSYGTNQPHFVGSCSSFRTSVYLLGRGEGDNSE